MCNWLGCVSNENVAIVLLSILGLSIPVSVSLPSLPAMDIARIKFNSGDATVQWNSQAPEPVTQIRFGIWSACIYNSQDHPSKCLKTAFPYKVTIATGENTIHSSSAVVQASWTHALIAHCIAAAITLFTILQGSILDLAVFHKYLTLKIRDTITVVLSYLVISSTMIALAIDIALLIHVSFEMAKLKGGGVEIKPGIGFVLTCLSLFPVIILSIQNWQRGKTDSHV